MQSPILPSDYKNALLTVAWLLKKEKRTLVFGFIELFPTELPKAETTAEDSEKCTNIEGARVFFERINLSFEDAIAIFQKAQEGVEVEGKNYLSLPVKGKNHSLCEVEMEAFCVEPMYPSLNLTVEAPYLPYNTQARTSHLYPFSLAQELEKIIQDEKIMKWLEEKFLFSFFKYTEYLGSFHLVAYNPVFRGVQAILVISDDAKESINYQINFRPNIPKDTLSLIQVEERNEEYSFETPHEVINNYFTIPLIGQAEKAGYIIHCTQRGVLKVYKPTPFIRHVHTSINVHIKTNEIHIKMPDGKTKAIQNEKYSAEKSKLTAGTIVQLHDTFYRKNSYNNKVERENHENMQKWFTSHDEATIFIRKIISEAKRRVWIVDPYFSPLELYKFAFATRYENIEIKIATSAEFLRTKEDTSDTNFTKEYGEILFNELLNNADEENLQICVLTGNKSPIHDRFLIIDDSIWMLGNSLNSIGNRAGAMVKIHYPKKIISEITSILTGERSISFEIWSERYRNNEEGGSNDAT